MHVRVCPDCDEEYRPEIVRCADCGATLVDRWEGEATDRAGDAGPPPSATSDGGGPAGGVPDDYRVVASGASASEIEPLAKRLGTESVPFAVRGSAYLFELLVPEQELERVLELFGAAEAPERLLSCPACGAELRGAGTCPDCGLSLEADPQGFDASRGPGERVE